MTLVAGYLVVTSSADFAEASCLDWADSVAWESADSGNSDSLVVADCMKGYSSDLGYPWIDLDSSDLEAYLMVTSSGSSGGLVKAPECSD